MFRRTKTNNINSLFKNKKKVLVLTISILILGMGLFGLTQKVPADTSTYEFSPEVEADKWGYGKSGDTPTSSTDYDFTATLGDYTNISSSDDTRWQIAGATDTNWDSQIYTFTINEPLVAISQLDFTWEGYGETCGDFTTYFYVWNRTSGLWENLDSTMTLVGDITLIGLKNTNITNYLDSEKLSLMVTTQRGRPDGETCTSDGECCSGNCTDGVCCDLLCGGDCEACNLTGSVGTCTDRAAGATDECGTCESCDTAGGDCDGITAIGGKNCIDDCTHCVSGACDDRLAGATDECGTCEACNSAGGNCAGITATGGKNCVDDCTHCVSGTCANRDIGDNTECGICEGCDAHELGLGDCGRVLTENTNTDTGWGGGLNGEDYGCVGDNKRCLNKECITCGGWVYDDGCAGCVGQGGRACWYLSPATQRSCDWACGEYGVTCVQEQWNDDTNCTVGEHFDDCSGTCDGGFLDQDYLPGTDWGLFKDCHYRDEAWTQDCDGIRLDVSSLTYRLCVCDH